MTTYLMRIALWGPLLIAALLAGAYVYTHDPFARDGTELLQVPLSEEDPALDRVGNLKYLGGLDIPRMDQNIGGLSGLRWDAQSGRLLAITDDARWVWITLEEEAKRLTGIAEIESGPLLGVDGEVLSGKEQGDSEALVRVEPSPEEPVRAEQATWGVAFEREHRILLYDGGLSSPPVPALFDPEEELGPMEGNRGMEAFAAGAASRLICAERAASPERSNCVLFSVSDLDYAPFGVEPPAAIEQLGGLPTDADVTSDEVYMVLFRSYSPAEGNSAALVAYAPDGTRREIATFLPPLNLDNFEGLAVREEGGRTFLYIVSDDNFSGSQRTLLMKFEVLPENQ